MPKPQGGTVTSIWRRDKRRCWICGHGVSRAEATRDHVQPKAIGGYDKSANYRLAHARCNVARGTLTIDQVLAVRASLPPNATAEMVRAELLRAQKDARTLRQTLRRLEARAR